MHWQKKELFKLIKVVDSYLVGALAKWFMYLLKKDYRNKPGHLKVII